MLRIAPFTFNQLLQFADNRKIEGIPTAAEIDFVSPGSVVHVRVAQKVGRRILPTASFVAMDKIFVRTQWYEAGERFLALHLNPGSGLIEELPTDPQDEEKRYRIVVSSKERWQHGVWNPLRLERVSLLTLN